MVLGLCVCRREVVSFLGYHLFVCGYVVEVGCVWKPVVKVVEEFKPFFADDDGDGGACSLSAYDGMHMRGFKSREDAVRSVRGVVDSLVDELIVELGLDVKGDV